MMYYVPGPKARVEYEAFHAPPHRRSPRPAPSLPPGEAAAALAPSTALAAPAASSRPSTPPDDTLRTQAHALVQYFHERFHGTPDAPPSARELTQARALLAQDGLEQARYLVDFSYTTAQETGYHPQTFGGILQYKAQARAAYTQAQERSAAAARAREERRRAQEAERRRRQYDEERAQRLAELRATTPPAVLAALEQAAAAHFERAYTGAYGRDILRRLAIEDALAAHFQLPDFAAWQARQERG